uniref:Prominin 2 n=1 Tax=Esox lucius TaxID=8010 RepID=A0A3P9AIJ2_ESOLU
MGAFRSVCVPVGCAGALLAWIWALLLGPSLAQPTASCAKGDALLNLTQPEYQSIPGADKGFMSGVVQSFLHTVQPNPFPKDLLLKFVNANGNIYHDQNTNKEVLLYEVGFLVCAAIGVVYIILMPVVGFFLACCRCCGNCGGHMYQRQTEAVDCHRRGLYWATLFTTLVLLAGNICMFFSNQSLKGSVKDSSVELNNTLDNFHAYLKAIPLQIDSVLMESDKTLDSVNKSLSEIGPLLGREIQRGIDGPLNHALGSVRDMAIVVNSTAVLLMRLNSIITQLRSDTSALQANVRSVRDLINTTLRNPVCAGCGAYQSELQKLKFDIAVTIPSLSNLQSVVDDITKADLNSKVKEAEDFFASIPQMVTNETKNVVQSVKQQLEDIKIKISAVKGQIPVTALNNVLNIIRDARRYIGMYSPEAQMIELIRWAVCITLSCVVLLVVVCNLLGLFLGLMGLSTCDDPTERSSTADCGGTFLMAGAGLSFLFSWLFMLVVLVLFLLGGNFYTLVCQPWRSGQLLQFVDTPGLIPGFNLGEMLGLKTNLTLSEIYNDCEQNRPLWTTLHLYEVINLTDLLNVSKYTAEIHQHFDSNEIKLSTITLLTPEISKQLHSYSDMAHGVDFSNATQQINNISTINVNETAQALEHLADNEGTVEDVLSNVGKAQDFLNNNTTQIIKADSKVFLDCQIGYFTKYAEWANLTITQKVGLCAPVAKAVDSAEVIVCKNMVESLNAFWFSLGWCLILLIPSIIFSIKLAKFYRRMKHSDVDDNHIPMHDIPRAQAKHY